jgi:SAM-dependent methyltransferase
MLTHGFIGGRVGDHVLRVLGSQVERVERCGGTAYRGRSKLTALFGEGFWREVAGKTVVDVGCGTGAEAVEMAERGARRVIGLDIREGVLEDARRTARERGVADRCQFATATGEHADLVVSLDGFEHYDDPAAILRLMRALLRPAGRARIAFGPPWFHPYGGHLFSVFPWAHLVFTERALIRWRARFKSDGATRFREVAGGLNQMTVGRFRQLLAASEFTVEEFAALPIRRLRHFSNAATREFVTSVVRCTLAPAPAGGPRHHPG